ncbi:MAG: hypothetical protein QXW42_04230 [Thermofilum sp.]
MFAGYGKMMFVGAGLMTLFFVAVVLLGESFPSPTSPEFKPNIFAASMFMFMATFGLFFYIFEYRRFRRWADYYFISETVRDVHGNEDIVLNCIYKGALEKPLYDYDVKLLSLDETYSTVLKEYEKLLNEKVRWVRVWAKVYRGGKLMYEGWKIYGTTVSLKEHCNFGREEILLEGMPAVIEIGNMETIEIGRIIEYRLKEKPYGLFRKLATKVQPPEDVELEEELVSEGYEPLRNSSYMYYRKPVPVCLIVNSPYLTQLYMVTGFGFLKQFKDVGEAVQNLAELKKVLTEDLVNTYQHQVSVRDQFIQDMMRRITDRKFEFEVHSEPFNIAAQAIPVAKRLPWFRILLISFLVALAAMMIFVMLRTGAV